MFDCISTLDAVLVLLSILSIHFFIFQFHFFISFLNHCIIKIIFLIFYSSHSNFSFFIFYFYHPGNAILSNQTLRTLILSSNGIESRACFTICMGIIENNSIKKVCLDGNPIGKIFSFMYFSFIYVALKCFQFTDSNNKVFLHKFQTYLSYFNRL